MNIIELQSAGSYPQDAEVRTLGAKHFEAYMVLGRQGTTVAVVTGSASDSMTAISVMTQKLKMLREQFDLMCHEAFWKHNEAEVDARRRRLHEALGIEDEPAKKDEGGLS